MTKSIIITFCLLVSLSSFAQEQEKIKYRKLDYSAFSKLSTNDTSQVIIDLFFDKKSNGAIGQMTILPVTLIIFPISPPISAGLTLISFPLFVNGTYMMIKYRKKKLHEVLTEYADTGILPKWVRNKAKKQLKYIELLKLDYQDQ